MRTGVTRDVRTAVIAVIASSITVAVPATAAIIATNPDSVQSVELVRAPSKTVDADTLDGLDSTAFLFSTGKAADADKLDGLDSTAFLPSTGKAADADKLDGLSSNDLLVTGGAKKSSYVNIPGCGQATLVHYSFSLDRPARIMATASTSLVGGTGLEPSIRIELLASGTSQVVANSSTVITRDTQIDGSLHVGELLMNTTGTAPFDAPAGNYVLRILADQGGLCDYTKSVQYSARLTHMVLAAGQ